KKYETSENKLKEPQSLIPTNSSRNIRRPRSAWTPEEDEALFNAINSVLAGQWKDVCAKSPLLKARGTSMTSQRFKTKIRYFVGGSAERGKK
ncbi:552_t:CDS:1, partial [Acaulospora colombiana]